MKAHGQFENVAFRAFEKKEHASQFLNGSIRFRHIYKYKNFEDKRQDTTEGEAHITVESSDYHSMFASTNVYVCCFHRTIEAAKKANFGRYIVQVKDPKLLAISITDHLKSMDGMFWGGVEGVIVEYNKGMTRQDTLSTEGMARLAYAQKPSEPFSIENEFRLAVICKENRGDILEITLAKGINGCQLLENI